MEPNDDKNKRIVDRRRFTLEDLTKKGKFIPLFKGRPKREEVIGKDDIMNLEIDLHTCTSIDSFLKGI